MLYLVIYCILICSSLGKTGAFCLPILQIVWETLRDLSDGKGASTTGFNIPAWTLSVFDRNDGLAVTPDGLRCQSRDQAAWNGCRATTGVRGRLSYN